MKHAILVYGNEAEAALLPGDAAEAVLAAHRRLQAALAERGPFASVQLMSTASAVTVRNGAGKGLGAPILTDGPFAETKEQFLGFYVADFVNLEEALRFAEMISTPGVALEVRPISWTGGAMMELG